MRKPSGCLGCPFYGNGRGFVPGCGDKNNPWILGESPGWHEVEQETPFVGASGHLLNRSLKGIGVQRSKLYITNTIKCQPPAGAKDLAWASAISQCSQYLTEEAAGARPKSIIAIGGKALWRLIGTHLTEGKPPSITFWRGSLWRQMDLLAAIPFDKIELCGSGGAFIEAPSLLRFQSNPVIMPTIHPAFIMRGMWQWLPVFARDLFRGLLGLTRRPLELPSMRSIGSGQPLRYSLEHPIIMDLETVHENPNEMTMMGALLHDPSFGRWFAIQDHWSDSLREPFSNLFQAVVPLVGHNHTNFDLEVMDINKVLHSGPYHDTITLSRLDEPDLPAALYESCSRTLQNYVQWKGSNENVGLQKVLASVYGLPEAPISDPSFWWNIYNLIDLLNTKDLYFKLMHRIGPARRWLFEHAHVRNVEHRRAMRKHGMKPDLPAFRRRKDELYETLGQLHAELEEVVEPLWEARLNEAMAPVRVVEKEIETLKESAAPGTPCKKHPKYGGWKSSALKCCRPIYLEMAPVRAQVKELSKKRTKILTSARKLKVGFNPEAPSQWEWLIFFALGHRFVTLPNGTQMNTPGLIRTPTGRYSVDDEALSILRRRLAKRGKSEPILELRAGMSRIFKKLSTYIEPVLSGRLIGLDGKLHPTYSDHRTATGRWASGSDEKGWGK